MTPAKNTNWIWIFIILAILGACAVTIPLVFNLQQQLTPAKVEEARAKWDRDGPKSYQMVYTQSGGAPGTYLVKVRDGKVESVRRKDREDQSDAEVTELGPLQRGYYGMPGLFDNIARFLEMDAEKNAPRAFNSAVFAPQDGHLLRYIRSVSSTDQRLEIRVTRFEPEK